MNYPISKKITPIATLFLAIACLIGIFAAMTTNSLYRVTAQTETKAIAKPNFTGVWKLNLTESKMPDGQSHSAKGYKAFAMSLIHCEAKIAVSDDIKMVNSGQDRIHSYITTTDGQEQPATLEGRPAIAWAKWEGNSLVVYHKRETGTDSKFSTKRTLTLSEDGRMIKSEMKYMAHNKGKDSPDYKGGGEVWEKQ